MNKHLSNKLQEDASMSIAHVICLKKSFYFESFCSVCAEHLMFIILFLFAASTNPEEVPVHQVSVLR